MPSIVILEKDETYAGAPAASTDIAFVPGFAQTNANCYVLTKSGETPMTCGADGSALRGTAVGFDKNNKPILANANRLNGVEGADDGFVGEGGPNYACNIVDEITWYCDPEGGSENPDTGFITSYKWTEQEVYIAPHAENFPVLCTTLADFETVFGKTPYRFKENQDVKELFMPQAVSIGSKYMYKAGDCDKSYIYAKELIRLGVPVIYENIVNRVKKYTYKLTYLFSAGCACSVYNEDALQTYLKNHNAKEFTLTWKAGDKRGFYDKNGKIFDKFDDIFNVVGAANLQEGDSITISEIKVAAGDAYEKETPSVTFLYSKLSDCFTNTEKLLDKGELTVKYITSGAYPTYELKDEFACTAAMITCAHDRGDAIAIIDPYNNPERTLNPVDSTSVYYNIHEGEGLLATDDYNTFATMFGPTWHTNNCITAPKGETVQLMPPSFEYLVALGNSIVTNPNWLAIAGINRGIASTIIASNSIERLTNPIADAYQPRDARALNGITNITPYGMAIWGNRTLASNSDGNLKALSFLNVRNMVCDIKKTAYTAAKTVLFEQDSDIMWNKFKVLVTPLLERMLYGYGISSYKVIRANTHINGDPLAKGEVAAIIKICPRYAVEDFEITVIMTEDGVDVS